MCLARKPSKTKKAKVRAIAERITATQSQGPTRVRRIIDQPTLYDYFELPRGGGADAPCERETIEASGDVMIQLEDGQLRIALQNPN